jgi:hypothetical protein
MHTTTQDHENFMSFPIETETKKYTYLLKS